MRMFGGRPSSRDRPQRLTDRTTFDYHVPPAEQMHTYDEQNSMEELVANETFVSALILPVSPESSEATPQARGGAVAAAAETGEQQQPPQAANATTNSRRFRVGGERGLFRNRRRQSQQEAATTTEPETSLASPLRNSAPTSHLTNLERLDVEQRVAIELHPTVQSLLWDVYRQSQYQFQAQANAETTATTPPANIAATSTAAAPNNGSSRSRSRRTRGANNAATSSTAAAPNNGSSRSRQTRQQRRQAALASAPAPEVERELVNQVRTIELQELERKIKERLEMEMHPKFQQALLDIHLERHEHTEQHASAGSDFDLTRFTTELQDNLQRSLLDQGIALDALQTRTLAELMVRQEEDRQGAVAVQPSRNARAPDTTTATNMNMNTNTRPPRQERGVETQAVEEVEVTSSTRSHPRAAPDGSSPRSHRSAHEASLPVRQWLVPTEVAVAPRPQLQKELSGLTLPWDLSSVNHTRQEQQQQQQQLEQQPPAIKNNSMLLQDSNSMHSQVSHSSRFLKEDYMDDDELADYMQQLESQPQSTRKLVNFMEEQQAAMHNMQRNNSMVPTTTSTPGAMAVQGDEKEDLMQRLTRKIQQEFPHLLQEDDDDDQEFSNDRVGPLPAQPTPRKSGRSRGLAEREDSDSHSQPSSHHSASHHSGASPVATGSLRSTPSIEKTLSSTSSTYSVLKCGKCQQPSDDKWLACDNLESPHLFCKLCVGKYLTQAPVTGAPCDLPDETNHLCRVPCFHKTKPCRGVVHVSAATVLDFAQTDKYL
jgi:hypothetical protein